MPVIALLVLGCETQEIIVHDEQHGLKVTGEYLPSMKRKPIDLIRFEKKLENKSKQLTLGREVHDTVNNFEIDEELVKHIQAGIYDSFTFSMKKEGDDKMHNLLLSKKIDGTYETILVIYEFTPEQLKSMSSEELAEKQTKYYPVEFDENGLMSYRFSMPTSGVACVEVWSVTQGDYNMWALGGSLLWLQQSPATHVLQSVSCEYLGYDSTGSGSWGFPTGPSYSNNQNGGNGGSSNPNNSNTTGGVFGNGGLNGMGVITTPVIPIKTKKDYKIGFEIILAQLGNESELEFWDSASEDQQQVIIDFLYEANRQPEFVEDGSTTDEINAFAIQMIQDMMSLTPTNYPLMLTRPFEWWLDTEQFNEVFEQDYDDLWRNISQAERNLSITFPQIALQIMQNRPIANQKTTQKFGFNKLNDKSDAFRHAYFQAINTKAVGQYYAKMFSDAHESETAPLLIKEKKMDLWNNLKVIKYSVAQPQLSVEQLVNAIYDLLSYGYLVYLTPLDFTASPFYDANHDMLQDCPTCLDGMLANTLIKYTNQ